MIRLASLVAVLSAASCAGGTKPAPPVQPPVTEPAPTVSRPAAKPPAPVVPWAQSGVDWSKPPAPGPTPRFVIPVPTTFTLANKLRVVVIANPKLPVVSMQLVHAHAGSSYERAAHAGLAALTADLLDEGAGAHDAVGLSKELERLGASIWISAGEQDVTVGLTTLSSTLAKSLELLGQISAKPALTNGDFARVKGDRLSAIRRRRDSPNSVAALLYAKVLWGDHAYGRPINGTAASLAKLRLADVRTFYRRHYAPRFAALFIAGDVDPTRVRSQLERTLGRWRARVATPRALRKPTPVKTPARLVVANKVDAAQSVVRIGRIGIARKDARYYRATVINAALGGSFAARLNHRLREQLGYTYGARSSFWYGDNTGSWTASSAIKTANTIAGIGEALKLIESVRSAELPADELRRTKSLLTRSLPQRFARNSSLVSVFADLHAQALPIDYYTGYAAGVDSVTAAQGREFASANWAQRDLVLVVVGDLKKILPGLLRLGLGAALELDPEGNVVKTHPAADAPN